jgi:hypothetical protein
LRITSPARAADACQRRCSHVPPSAGAHMRRLSRRRGARRKICQLARPAGLQRAAATRRRLLRQLPPAGAVASAEGTPLFGGAATSPSPSSQPFPTCIKDAGHAELQR